MRVIAITTTPTTEQLRMFGPSLAHITQPKSDEDIKVIEVGVGCHKIIVYKRGIE